MDPLMVAADVRGGQPAPHSGLRRIMAISSSLASTTVVTSILGLVFWTLAARSFSVAAVGVAGAAIASMTLLGTLGSFGLGTLLISRLPHTPQGSRRLLVRTALLAAGLLALLLAIVVPLVAIAGFDAQNLSAVAGSPGRGLLFAVGTGLMAAALVLDQAVLVLGSGSLQLERNLTASGTKVVVLLLLSVTGQTSGMAIFLAWTVGTLVSLPLVAWRTRGGRALEAGNRLVAPSSLRGLGRAAASHHALNTTLQAPLQLLPLIVLVTLSARDNGVFSAALQVTGFVFALPFALAVGLFAAARGDEREVLERMKFTLPLGLGLSVLAILALFPLAPYLLSVFGSVYADQGTTVLRVLVLAGIPFVIKDHFVALRRVQGRTTQATVVLLGGTAAELAGAVLGARLGGTVGLCVGWVIVLAFEAVLLGIVLLRSRAISARTQAASAAPPQSGLSVAEPGSAVVSTPPTERPAESPGRLGRLFRVIGIGPVLLLMSGGLLAIAEAAARSRQQLDGGSAARTLYVLGLVLIFFPAAVGVLLPNVRRVNRVLLVVAMPVLLQLSRLVLYPTRFTFHDELLHANVLRQISASEHLFSVNPLLPISAYYPGLEIVTNAVRSLTGLSPHTSAVVTLLVTRVVLALVVLGIAERLTGSTRVGAVASLIYACNPQMLAFNSQFSYQTLALPLAALTAYLFLTRRHGARWALALPVLGLAAVAVTHHVTMGLLVLAFAGWWRLALLLRRGAAEARSLAIMAVVGAALLAATVANPGNTLGSYLAAIVASSEGDLSRLARGESTKALFTNSAGVASAPWEQALILASLLVTVLVLIPALLHARKWLRARVSAAVLLSLIALLYPVIPGGHLTRATAEVGDRAAGFVYLGVAFVVAGWAWSGGRRAARLRASAGAALATVAFLGGVVLGAGPTATQLPGPFRVSADARSVDAPSLAAAAWMAANLPDETRIYADRVSGLLAAAYGDQFTVRHISTDVDASRLLLSPDFGQADVDVIRAAGIEYVVADRRNAFGLPNEAVYIESGEFGERGRTEPVPAAALRKFDNVAGVDRIYDNGSIAIYDVRALTRGVTLLGVQPDAD